MWLANNYKEDFSMRYFKFYVLIALTLWMMSSVDAAPIAIPAVRITPATKVYTFFTFDARKLSKLGLTVQQEIDKLTQQLISTDPAVPSITPCPIATDLNVTGVSCGTGAIRLGTNELFTYNMETLLPPVPVKLDNGVSEQYGANFLSPNGTFPGDSTGRVVGIHFKQRMAQFGLMIDPGLAGSVNGIQFIVNRQATPVQPIAAGVPQFVGVEDSAGFTDVTIIASGTPRAWIADQFSYLPLAAF
jgi:hypothetical protein